MTIKNSFWPYIKEFYKKSFGYPYHITDYISCKEILKLSCCGYSNFRISKRLGMSEKYVVDVLLEFLNFSGWGSDLSFSPLALYNMSNSLDDFSSLVYNIDRFVDDRYIEFSYMICKTYKDIEKELLEYGY